MILCDPRLSKQHLILSDNIYYSPHLQELVQLHILDKAVLAPRSSDLAMSRLHTAFFVAAILCGLGLGFLLTASTSLPIEQIAATLAAGLANAVVAVLAIAVSAMTVLAGGLVVADFRTDFVTAQSWQTLDSHVILDDRPVDVGAADVDWKYTLRPQDEVARRIFLTLRLAMQERHAGDRCQASTATEDTAEPTASDDASIPMACQPGADVPSREANTVGRAPTLIADNPGLPIRTNASIGQSRRAWRGSQDRLVANAGRWLAGELPRTRSATTAGHPASVIVLADVSRRGDQPSALDLTAVSCAPSETTCRGPPSAGGRSVGTAGNTPRPHHDIDVVDNLGRPVPIGVAELNVTETYLGDVLGDVVGASGAAKDRQTA